MAKKKKLEDLDKRLDILMMKNKRDIMKELCEIDIYNKFNPWTPLKLIALSYFAGPYLRIIGNLKNKYYGNLFVVYIDVFAGSGVNKLNGSYTVGSPIVAIDSANTAECKFDMIYLADIEKTYTEALHKRLKLLEKYEEYSWIRGRYKIYEEDANKALLKIVKELNRIHYKNYLAFIDPYKCDMEWSSLAELLKIRGDLLITHQARLIAKEIGRYRSSGLTENKTDKITKYLGIPPDEWIKLNTEEKVKNFYIAQIKKYKDFVRVWSVKSGRKHKGYSYYLIFCSSQSNPKWKGIIENLARFEDFTGDLVQHCIDRTLGKMRRITDY
ncbi:MAG: three-Cys-motif partner protein TcmP [Thermoplasmata archaeon]|nr:three-Cys-motif partner protein TcmP [Thermoplasmata archaeon]